MGSGISGPGITKLAALARKMADAQTDLYSMVVKNLEAEALTQVSKGFRESRDPYGVAWAPLKRRQGKPLLDTGRMRNSFSTQTLSNGFRLGSNVKYAPYHQFGTGGRKHAGHRLQQIDKKGRFAKAPSAHIAAVREAAAQTKFERLVRQHNWTKNKSSHASRKRHAMIVALEQKLARVGSLSGNESRRLNFKAGGGKIPARPMIPIGQLGPIWSEAFKDAGLVAFRKFFK